MGSKHTTPDEEPTDVDAGAMLSSCLFDCRMLPEPPTTDAYLSTFAKTPEIDFYSIWQDTIRWVSTITK